MFAGMQVGVILHGPEAITLAVNDAAARLLGFTRAQLVGKAYDPDWRVVHEDGTPFPGTAHPVPVAIATGKPVRNVVMGIYRPRHKDTVWLHVDAVPEVDGEGRVRQVVCTFFDITARTGLEQRHRAALRVAEALIAPGSLQDLLAAIHRILAELIHAPNFYIALRDSTAGMVSFPYFVDQMEAETPPARPLGRGFTEWVMRTGKPVLLTPETSAVIEAAGEATLIGPTPIEWLGVPL
jgi:PAS domain S-box-containing protein